MAKSKKTNKPRIIVQMYLIRGEVLYSLKTFPLQTILVPHPCIGLSSLPEYTHCSMPQIDKEETEIIDRGEFFGRLTHLRIS